MQPQQQQHRSAMRREDRRAGEMPTHRSERADNRRAAELPPRPTEATRRAAEMPARRTERAGEVDTHRAAELPPRRTERKKSLESLLDAPEVRKKRGGPVPAGEKARSPRSSGPAVLASPLSSTPLQEGSPKGVSRDPSASTDDL
jgi:hypothetical protein